MQRSGGAARVVFSQDSMTDFEKSEQDIAGWIAIFAPIAYEDPLRENRRLVLHRLAKDFEACRFDVFEQATADPDRTVRRYAIDALEAHGGPEAIRILRHVATGEIQPRRPAAMPTDYTKGADLGYATEDTGKKAYTDTDQEAAAPRSQASRSGSRKEPPSTASSGGAR